MRELKDPSKLEKMTVAEEMTEVRDPTILPDPLVTVIDPTIEKMVTPPLTRDVTVVIEVVIDSPPSDTLQAVEVATMPRPTISTGVIEAVAIEEVPTSISRP